ncbi:hypothetical protein LPJ64_000481 [Coemansia asiatica]|uniref:Uncharacterized protein n=1 Tax=Coemansia asiatica TaxID=1052880 RepID=A0A9W8CMV0_9FUNG|nr:hypothetical protein LPJ64_000481 [Coemansia asiatica]
MKLSLVSAVLAAGAALTSAHYECTTEQAFDVLFNNATTDALAQKILVSLEKGVIELRNEISQVDAEKAATTISLVLFFLGSSTVLAHQGCNVDAAFDTLLGEVTIEHVSNALLLNLQRSIKSVLKDIETTSPQQLADNIVDRYRVLQAILSYAGIKLPII